jgi:hypothetical protein
MIQHLRRGILILLASVAVALGILQLGDLGWAERMRVIDQDKQLARAKYQYSHKSPQRRPGPPRATSQRYARGFVQVVMFEIGLPCAATLGVLAFTRRKRPRPGDSGRAQGQRQ